MSYSQYAQISDPGLLTKLDRAVRDLRKLGYSDSEISRYIFTKAFCYNRSPRANPHKILLGQLNRYLADQKLPSISGNDNDPV
jgi:hypothetical protein